jgi:hypothetical protein
MKIYIEFRGNCVLLTIDRFSVESRNLVGVLELGVDAEAHFGQSQVVGLHREIELSFDDALGEAESSFLDEGDAGVEEATGNETGITEAKCQLHLLHRNLAGNVGSVFEVVAESGEGAAEGGKPTHHVVDLKLLPYQHSHDFTPGRDSNESTKFQ